MTEKQADNYKILAMVIFYAAVIFFIGFLVGGGCSGGGGCHAPSPGPDDDWFESSASRGERWDAR
jgi:hypothetical protein